MKTTLEKTSALNRRLNVEIPAEIVSNAFDDIYKNLQKQVTLKGFRKGKAPIQTLKSLYNEQVKGDVVENLIRRHFGKALQEQQVEPFTSPEFEYDEPTEAKEFSFTATFDVRPEVNLKSYESLSLEREQFVDDDSRVDKVLENIRTSRATQADVLEVRPAIMGDIAIIDFEGSVDGKPLDRGSGTDFHLELGANQFIEGFEPGVVGMSVGQVKTLNLKFPDQYQAPEIAGKEVEFKVTLKSLKKKVLPELNDEFLATWGGPKSLEELKTAVRTDIEQSEKKRINEAFKNDLMKKLVDLNPLEVPVSIKDQQKQSLIEDFKKRSEEQGTAPDQIEDYIAKWDDDFEKLAREIVHASFLIDAIAKKHDLVCKEDDINRKLQSYVDTTKIEPEKIAQWYSETERREKLAYSITEEKVIDYLLKSAKVKEVPPAKTK